LQIAASLEGCTELAVTDSRQEVVLYDGVWEESSQCMNVKMSEVGKVTRGLRLDRFFRPSGICLGTERLSAACRWAVSRPVWALDRPAD